MDFQTILAAKREYYGNTEAAIEFAAEEFAKQTLDEYKQVNYKEFKKSFTVVTKTGEKLAVEVELENPLDLIAFHKHREHVSLSEQQFREDVFVFHACLGIASLKALVLEMKEDYKEIEKIREQLVNLFNKWDKTMTQDFRDNRGVVVDKLQREVEKFAKKYVR